MVLSFGAGCMNRSSQSLQKLKGSIASSSRHHAGACPGKHTTIPSIATDIDTAGARPGTLTLLGLAPATSRIICYFSFAAAYRTNHGET